jgi:hypothetical protein
MGVRLCEGGVGKKKSKGQVVGEEEEEGGKYGKDRISKNQQNR